MAIWHRFAHGLMRSGSITAGRARYITSTPREFAITTTPVSSSLSSLPPRVSSNRLSLSRHHDRFAWGIVSPSPLALIVER